MAPVQLVIQAKAQLSALKETLLGLRGIDAGAKNSGNAMRELRAEAALTGAALEQSLRDRHNFGHLPKQAREGADSLEKLGEKAKSTGEKMGGMNLKLLNLYAGFGILRGAVMSVRAAMTPFANEVGRLSRLDDLKTITGESVKNLVVMERALQNSGRSGADIATTFRYISLAMDQAKNPTSKQAQAFRELKIHMDDFAAQSPVGKIQTLTAALAKIESPSRKAALATRLLGESAVELMPLLSDSGAFTRAASEVGGLGDAAEKNAARLKRLGEDLSLAGVHMREVMIAALERALPLLEMLARNIERIPAQTLATGLTAAAVAAGAFGTALGVSRLVAWSIEIKKSIALLAAKAASYRAVGNAAAGAAAKESLANRARGGLNAVGSRMGGMGTAVAGAAVVGFTADRVTALAGAVSEYGDAVSKADKALHGTVTMLGKYVDNVGSEKQAKEALVQVERELARVRREQAAWYSSNSTKALTQAEKELVAQRKKLQSLNEETIATQKQAAAERDLAQQLKNVAAMKESAKPTLNSIRDARQSARESGTAGYSRLSVLNERAAHIAADAGIEDADTPGAVLQEIERKIAELKEQLNDVETADKAVEELKRLEPFYKSALSLMQEFKEQKRTIRDEEKATDKKDKEEALALDRKKLETEREQLEWSLERKKISLEKYAAARRTILAKQHALEEKDPEKNKGSDVASRALEKTQLERELYNKRKEIAAPQIQSDRLARIGGTLGGGNGQTLNYARRSADAADRHTKLLGNIVTAIERLGTGNIGAIFAS